MKYMIKMFSRINFKKFNKIINESSKKSGKSKIYIFFDMIGCFFKYQAGYADYIFFEMYNLSKKERKTILTRGKNNSYVKRLNPKEYWEYIDNKALFNEKFKDFLNREYMVLNSDNYIEFKDFIKKHKEIIIKPLDATCGVGVEKVVINDKTDSSKLYKKLLDNKQILIEEVAKQHKDMNKLHPNSINTIRVVTIHNKYDVTTVVAAVCRMGTAGRVVDNFHNGGICAPLDAKKGIINDRAVDKQGNFYDTHPTTKTKLIGYQIPKWDKIVKLVTEASKKIPELGLIGWDVCVGPDKPCLIEANQYPAYDLYKMIKIPNSVGIIPVFEDALNKRK